MRLFIFIMAVFATLAGTSPTMAKTDLPQAPDEKMWRVAVFNGIWTENKLRKIPLDIATGNINLRDSQMFSLALSRVIFKDFDIPLPFTDFAFKGNDLEFEVQAVKHFGLQNHVELTAALIFRTGDLHIGDAFYVNIATGQGISYALSPPAYEIGATRARGVRSYQFQYHISVEAEFTLEGVPDWHLVPRIHHRSGLFGLISPKWTASNFLTLGLRKDF